MVDSIQSEFDKKIEFYDIFWNEKTSLYRFMF